MIKEPYVNNYIKQSTSFQFFPSLGMMRIYVQDRMVEFDMKDVFLMHGWLGSMIMHFMDEVKSGKSKHSRLIKSIMEAEQKKSLQIEHKKVSQRKRKQNVSKMEESNGTEKD